MQETEQTQDTNDFAERTGELQLGPGNESNTDVAVDEEEIDLAALFGISDNPYAETIRHMAEKTTPFEQAPKPPSTASAGPRLASRDFVALLRSSAGEAPVAPASPATPMAREISGPTSLADALQMRESVPASEDCPPSLREKTLRERSKIFWKS